MLTILRNRNDWQHIYSIHNSQCISSNFIERTSDWGLRLFTRRSITFLPRWLMVKNYTISQVTSFNIMRKDSFFLLFLLSVTPYSSSGGYVKIAGPKSDLKVLSVEVPRSSPPLGRASQVVTITTKSYGDYRTDCEMVSLK